MSLNLDCTWSHLAQQLFLLISCSFSIKEAKPIALSQGCHSSPSESNKAPANHVLKRLQGCEGGMLQTWLHLTEIHLNQIKEWTISLCCRDPQRFWWCLADEQQQYLWEWWMPSCSAAYGRAYITAAVFSSNKRAVLQTLSRVLSEICRCCSGRQREPITPHVTDNFCLRIYFLSWFTWRRGNILHISKPYKNIFKATTHLFHVASVGLKYK